MFNVEESKNGESINFTLSSEIRIVDHIIREAQNFLMRFDIMEFSGFKLVLRELLNNAIEHGNFKITERIVYCHLRYLGGKRFKLTVEDEGNGFNYDKLIMKLPEDPRQIRNRGYALVNAFSDQIDFNDTGNRVSAYITFAEETTYDVVGQEDWQVIIPSGNLTAASADNFRSQLIKLRDKGFSRYRFDFKNVDDIDSVSLSVLILFAGTLSSQDGKKLEVVNMKKDLQDLFYMTRMDQIYSIV